MSSIVRAGSVGSIAAAVAKGDLLVATGPGIYARLPVGSTGQTLTVDPTTATGLRWAASTGSSSTAAAIDSGVLDSSTLG